MHMFSEDTRAIDTIPIQGRELSFGGCVWAKVYIEWRHLGTVLLRSYPRTTLHASTGSEQDPSGQCGRDGVRSLLLPATTDTRVDLCWRKSSASISDT